MVKLCVGICKHCKKYNKKVTKCTIGKGQHIPFPKRSRRCHTFENRGFFFGIEEEKLKKLWQEEVLRREKEKQHRNEPRSF